jgi:hypothetical protein
MQSLKNVWWEIWFRPLVLFLVVALITLLVLKFFGYYFSKIANVDKIIDLSAFAIMGGAFIGLLWNLLYRYKRFKTEPQKTTKVMLCVFTILYFIVVMSNIVLLILGRY